MTESANTQDRESLISRISPIQVALGLTLIWSIAFFIPFLSADVEAETVASPVLSLLTFLMPLLFIWLTAIMIASMRRLSSETKLLRHSIEAMHHNLESEMAALSEDRDSWLLFQQEQLSKMSELRQSPSETAMSSIKTFTPFEPNLDPEETAQYGLPLNHPRKVEIVPLDHGEIVRALNFPNNADDKEGLRLMRRASEDRQLVQLMKTAQSTLTNLAQDGVFMDDLVPDAPQAQVWRRFAKGIRGPAIAALGGIRDRSALALTKGRLKGDVEFRETAHNLLREFDRFILEFEKTATDDDLLSLGQTRTGRAFMLLGRCTGSFEKAT
ncbi:MAG: hypothetical protein AAF826_07680 [Pseudomonadota bacterium]